MAHKHHLNWAHPNSRIYGILLQHTSSCKHHSVNHQGCFRNPTDDTAPGITTRAATLPPTDHDLLEVPERQAPRLNSEVLAALIRSHLEWVARGTPRRAVGGSIVLLPEDAAKLAEEIAYHETTGRIMPRARRQNTVNPHIPYRKKPP
jgi:hypothetical protein